MLEVECILRTGASILEAKLNPHGFLFEVVSSGKGSGGEFAEGCFRSGDRELRLSFRRTLGLIRYRKGQAELTHEQYMRALGLRRVARYPGYSKDPLAAFADLLSDLEHCDDFLLDDGQRFSALAANYVEPPKGFQRLGSE